MGLKDVLRGLSQSVDRLYERRIRAASLVKEYRVGGHGHAGEHEPQHEAAAAELRHGQEAPQLAHAGEMTDQALVSDSAPH
ncbi:MAG: hypothetical protein KatS3mg057_1294 [Herpetosiphonaceae bacterium]|nr:MAG: hypothetical protein KatS3mg057_1294 [Herpetosiphonaceae bacterium]